MNSLIFRAVKIVNNKAKVVGDQNNGKMIGVKTVMVLPNILISISY